MDYKLLYRLRAWRSTQAQKEGVEVFRVLPNTTLEEIARVLPRNRQEFLAIKGIKESRFSKYGAQLLAMTADTLESASGGEASVAAHNTNTPLSIPIVSDDTSLNESEGALFESFSQKGTLYTVSSFLDTLNMVFEEMVVRIQGEVSSVDERDKTIYFSLKDPKDGSMVQCLIFRYQYIVSGVKLMVGQEVIIEGTPGIWKPAGRLSVKASSLEVSGVGALQKAYDDLKNALEKEGVFSPERKKPFPKLPQKNRSITSQQGAAIGDFLMNVGKHGFSISLYNSSVEGKKAVYDLIDAVKYFQKNAHLYDVLVVIRGGGSLESLQAFNNEALVREVIKVPLPVLAGVGHEKDVSLVALAADVMVSTPTATARFLRQGYEDARRDVDRLENTLLESFRSVLQKHKTMLQNYEYVIPRFFQSILLRHEQVIQRFMRCLEQYEYALRTQRAILSTFTSDIFNKLSVAITTKETKLMHFTSVLKIHNPQRMLDMGYAYVKKNSKVIRRVDQVHSKESLTVYMSDGALDVTVDKKQSL